MPAKNKRSQKASDREAAKRAREQQHDELVLELNETALERPAAPPADLADVVDTASRFDVAGHGSLEVISTYRARDQRAPRRPLPRGAVLARRRSARRPGTARPRVGGRRRRVGGEGAARYWRRDGAAGGAPCSGGGRAGRACGVRGFAAAVGRTDPLASLAARQAARGELRSPRARSARRSC